MIDAYTAGRRLKMGDGWREPGEPVPEAYTWMRKQDWVHTGYVKEVKVSEKDFRASIAKYCPELTDQIITLAGLDPTVLRHGPQGMPHKIPVPLKAKGK